MFQKKTCLMFLENKALRFVLICHFEQDEASTGCFDVRALGMIHSHSLVTPSFISSESTVFNSFRTEHTDTGFEASEITMKKSLGFVPVPRSWRGGGHKNRRQHSELLSSFRVFVGPQIKGKSLALDAVFLRVILLQITENLLKVTLKQKEYSGSHTWKVHKLNGLQAGGIHEGLRSIYYSPRCALPALCAGFIHS